MNKLFFRFRQLWIVIFIKKTKKITLVKYKYNNNELPI